MTFSAFVGLFQYFMGFLVSCKAISVMECQIFAKTMFLEFWLKFRDNLPVCQVLPVEFQHVPGLEQTLLTLIGLGGGSWSPPWEIIVRHFWLVVDTGLIFGDF